MKKQRILITGGGSGIGEAISRRFGELGADVAIHFASNGKSAETIAEQIRARGGNSFAIGGDFSDSSVPPKVVAEAIRRLGGLDILINNAAWDPGATQLAATDAAFIEKLLAVNVTAPLLCIRAAHEALKASADGGRIVNIGSIQSEHSLAGHSAYAASKGALDALTRQLAVELGADGIRVNSVNPGFIQIARTTNGKTEADLDRRAARVPLRRLGVPADTVGAIEMLCSPQAAYITGQILVVDGGSIRLLPTHVAET